MARDKAKPVASDAIQQALSGYSEYTNLPRLVASGIAATIAAPGLYPEWLKTAGENPRSGPRNELLGHYVTIPAPGYLGAGICYVDHADNQDDQDMRLLDTRSGTIEAVSPQEFACRFPTFGAYHRSAQRQFFKELGRDTPCPPK